MLVEVGPGGMQQRPSRARVMLALLAAALLAAALLAPSTSVAEPAKQTVFSDGSHVPVRRVFTYRQDDGVTAYTDKAPMHRPYEIMEFACYACDPQSKVDWRSTTLHREKYAQAITSAARAHGVDAALIRAVIHAESGFNPFARSPKGAAGLMQLMPGTAADMGVADVDVVADNIDGGTRYLAMLLDQFRGDVTLALAAYNAGPANVDRYGGVPPFAETRTYVERVKILHGRYKT